MVEDFLFPGRERSGGVVREGFSVCFSLCLGMGDELVVLLAVRVTPAFAGSDGQANTSLDLLDGTDGVVDLQSVEAEVVEDCLYGVGDETFLRFLRGEECDREHASRCGLTTAAPGQNSAAGSDVVHGVDEVHEVAAVVRAVGEEEDGNVWFVVQHLMIPI